MTLDADITSEVIPFISVHDALRLTLDGRDKPVLVYGAAKDIMSDETADNDFYMFRSVSGDTFSRDIYVKSDSVITFEPLKVIEIAWFLPISSHRKEVRNVALYETRYLATENTHITVVAGERTLLSTFASEGGNSTMHLVE